MGGCNHWCALVERHKAPGEMHRGLTRVEAETVREIMEPTVRRLENGGAVVGPIGPGDVQRVCIFHSEPSCPEHAPPDLSAPMHRHWREQQRREPAA